MAIAQNLPDFLLYFATALALLGLFACIYIRLTPYAELQLIRQGNLAAALSLLGAVLGFALPLASSIAHSVSLQDMALWGLIALLIQALAYLVASRLLPGLKQGICDGVVAHGVFLGGTALSVGLINAACLVY